MLMHFISLAALEVKVMYSTGSTARMHPFNSFLDFVCLNLIRCRFCGPDESITLYPKSKMLGFVMNMII